MRMKEVCNTLDCMHDKQAIMYETVYDMTHATDVIRECQNTVPTLQHRMGTGGNQVPIKVERAKPPRRYIVRRLTPLECCRLQGFPDWWCNDLQEEAVDEFELAFWRNVFDTYCEVTGVKKKTDIQIIKWLQSEPADNSVYKMWGNGINLPCALDVMQGIIENS